MHSFVVCWAKQNLTKSIFVLLLLLNSLSKPENRDEEEAEKENIFIPGKSFVQVIQVLPSSADEKGHINNNSSHHHICINLKFANKKINSMYDKT